mmetsp:Transcript_124860/g.388687  ORF Transcript_124860/g.388687 Transcript_124860/m.388687 type:complete len:228 (-) Transcript_124860:431-1114(-)
MMRKSAGNLKALQRQCSIASGESRLDTRKVSEWPSGPWKITLRTVGPASWDGGVTDEEARASACSPRSGCMAAAEAANSSRSLRSPWGSFGAGGPNRSSPATSAAGEPGRSPRGPSSSSGSRVSLCGASCPKRSRCGASATASLRRSFSTTSTIGLRDRRPRGSLCSPGSCCGSPAAASATASLCGGSYSTTSTFTKVSGLQSVEGPNLLPSMLPMWPMRARKVSLS